MYRLKHQGCSKQFGAPMQLGNVQPGLGAVVGLVGARVTGRFSNKTTGKGFRSTLCNALSRLRSEPYTDA